ncbi:hypothetical protein HBH81_066200 [Parastagonospora nodorum]|nr:hypothetical protein HBH81_066200 [Parastagonospora nodorum]KAH6238924.1 hypothetical protein HBI15_036190 [Parastagonospora nodorum]
MNTPPTSVNVYTTCRQVNTEVFSPMANNLAELSPLPRVIVEVESLRFIHCDYGRLWFVSVHLLLVARDRDNNGEIDLSDAMVFALKRAENWMDGKVLGLVACMQKWFVLFERKRLLAGQHSTLDSVPTVHLASFSIDVVEMEIRNANFGVEYGLVYHSTSIFQAISRYTCCSCPLSEDSCSYKIITFPSNVGPRVFLAEFSASLAYRMKSFAASTKISTDNERVVNAQLGSPCEDAEPWEIWSA